MRGNPDRKSEQKRQEKKERDARRALLAFLKRLRKACETFSTVDEWYQFLNEVFNPLLEEHKQGLSAENQRRLREATRLTDATREGISNACEALEFQIERVVGSLIVPQPFPLTNIVIGAVIVVAGVVGAGVIALNLLAAEVTVKNIGCDPIRLSTDYNWIPGVEIPAERIATDEEQTLKIPPISVEIDSAPNGAIGLTAFGTIEIDFSISGDVSSLRFDDQPDILGRRVSIDIKPGSLHELVVECR